MHRNVTLVRGDRFGGALAALAATVRAPATNRGPRSVARAEIERILGADNLDTAGRPASDVVETMARISRGRAPSDFWQSYERHLQAWERFADASQSTDVGATDRCERAINTSFDEVERIARRYGARMPQPRAR